MSNYGLLKEQFTSANPPRSLFPLLWLHGDEKETEVVLRREIAAMDDGGCGGFIIESRPHSDYLGENWWRDVGICLDEASLRNMQVWIFDEEYYPSGIAGGRVLSENADYRMQVLVKDVMRYAHHRLKSFQFNVPEEWDALLKIVCFPVTEEGLCVMEERKSFYDPSSFNEWSSQQELASIYRNWDILRIGLRKSWSGRMTEFMVDYLCPEITDRFIAITYEATKERFGNLFGTTIKGFFGDETSFENFASYDVLFGEDTPCMPWTRVLLDTFQQEKKYDLLANIE
ncbi:MAG TPA: hypothetical protein VGE40_02510, partial [Bacilli bacterium]